MRATGAGLSSVILWVLGTVPVVSKRLTFLKMKMHRERSRDSMPHSAQIRRDYLYQNKAILTFFSGEINIAAFHLNFCQIKSTNVGNNMSKSQSFRSIIVEMACD